MRIANSRGLYQEHHRPRRVVGPTAALLSRVLATRGLAFIPGQNSKWGSWTYSLEKGSSLLEHRELRARGRLVGEPRHPRTPEFGVPSKYRTSRFRAVKTLPTSLVHTEIKMSTHKYFEAGIGLHSLSIIGYNRNINGMRTNFKESHFCPLNPLVQIAWFIPSIRRRRGIWQAPASTHKTQKETHRPAICRSARWRVGNGK